MSLQIQKQAAEVYGANQAATAALTIGTTTVVVDLTSLPSPASVTAGLTQPGQSNAIGKYILLHNDGTVVLYYALAPTFALAAACLATAATTVNGGNGELTIAGTEMQALGAGLEVPILISPASPALTSNIKGTAGLTPSGPGTPQAQTPPGGLSVNRYLALLAASTTTVARFNQRSS